MQTTGYVKSPSAGSVSESVYWLGRIQQRIFSGATYDRNGQPDISV